MINECRRNVFVKIDDRLLFYACRRECTKELEIVDEYFCESFDAFAWYGEFSCKGVEKKLVFRNAFAAVEFFNHSKSLTLRNADSNASER